SHTASIGKDVRHHGNTALLEHLVGHRRHRSVGTLHNHPGPHVGSIRPVENSAECSRYEDINIHGQQVFIRDGFCSIVADNGAFARCHFAETAYIEAIAPGNASVNVAHGHDACTEQGQVVRGPAAHIAEALHRHTSPLQ